MDDRTIIHTYTRSDAIEDGALITVEQYFGRSKCPDILLEGLRLLEQGRAAKFELGELVITTNAARKLAAADVFVCLIRHHLGDWGELDAEDITENNRALEQGHRVLSVYDVTDGGDDATQVRFYIITEWNREATTVLLPEDY